MNFPFYIAKRYLFSKKSHNAINVISAISVCGVALATLALVCTLSVFNGFHHLVEGLFTAFDPELKITVTEGKVFHPNTAVFQKIKKMPEVAVFSLALQDNALVQYQDKQVMAVVKGVDDAFADLTPIDSVLLGRGELVLHDDIGHYAIPGLQLLGRLGSGLRFLDPLNVYAPVRGKKVNMANPTENFKRGYLFASGLAFAVNQAKYDDSYIITSLDFARELFQYKDEVSSVSLRLKEGTDVEAFQQRIEQLLGTKFQVANRYQQQEDTYKIMKIEKFISYLFLTFILLIACFNVIGSLSMLIIDKKADVNTLRNLGASDKQIVKIFLFEGRMISLIGAVTGVVLGVVLCLLQQQFGFISLGNAGSFIVSAYPVHVELTDIVLVFVTVLAVGFLSVWYPVRYLSKRLLKS